MSDADKTTQGFINLLVYQANFGEWFTTGIATNPNTGTGGWATREAAVNALLAVVRQAAK